MKGATAEERSGTREVSAPSAGPAEHAERRTDDACLNCGARLTGPYCASCGQKDLHTDPTFRELLHDTAQELTHWEGKLPSTLKALLLRPGLLTVDFLAGRRARWIPPLRLYLICSIAFFVSKPLVEAITHRSAREVAQITITNPDGSTGLTPEGRRRIEEGLPGRIFGAERLERAAANSRGLNRAIDSAFPKAMFVLLPLFALLTNVAWRRTMPRYPAHLYAALHLHAAWFGVLALCTVATVVAPSDEVALVIGLAGLAYVVWYALAAVHRIFGDSWAKTIAKAAGVAAVYSACLGLVSLAMLGYALLTM